VPDNEGALAQSQHESSSSLVLHSAGSPGLCSAGTIEDMHPSWRQQHGPAAGERRIRPFATCQVRALAHLPYLAPQPLHARSLITAFLLPCTRVLQQLQREMVVAQTDQTGLHGTGSRFLPIVQIQPKEHYPRTICVAGAYPGLTAEVRVGVQFNLI
jgi:hypothetical protein